MKPGLCMLCQEFHIEKYNMTDEKRVIFPISLLAGDDPSGGRSISSGGRRNPTSQKADYRKLPLRNLPLLSALSDAGLSRLEKQSQRVTFTKGQEIVRRGDRSQEVFFLLSGQARVTFYSAGGKAVAFRRIDPGDVFGEFAAIDGEGRSATVEAARPSTALSMPYQLFWELTETDPGFTRAVMRHLVGLLRVLTARIVEFSTLGVRNRVHCELLRMAKKALEESGNTELSPAPTHSDLAARISTHREAVSRELSRLNRLGIIERKGRTITVKNMTQLERLVVEASGE
jgi:CRP/FNR family transcriptional regulator, cyclic AMP receptor protein